MRMRLRELHVVGGILHRESLVLALWLERQREVACDVIFYNLGHEDKQNQLIDAVSCFGFSYDFAEES